MVEGEPTQGEDGSGEDEAEDAGDGGGGEHAGGEEAYYHGLNCSILSMMLAKELDFARAHCQILGVGALLHDIGLNDIPDRVARPRHELTAPERNLRQLQPTHRLQAGMTFSSIPVSRNCKRRPKKRKRH